MELTATGVPACATSTVIVDGQTLTVLAPDPLKPQDYLRTLDQIVSPSQLPAGVLLSATSARNLQFQTPTPWGFDLHFLNESVRGVIHGTTGLRLDAAGDAHLTATIASSFTATLQRDDLLDEPWLRLTLRQAAESAIHGAAKAFITVNVETAPPGAIDPLLQALLGFHPLQWLRTSLAGIGSLRFNQVAQLCGVPPSTLETVLDLFHQLSARSEAVLWKAAATPPDLATFLSWNYWIATECPDLATLHDRVAYDVQCEPTFPNSLVGQWLEAVSGVSLLTLDSEPAWDRIRQTASLIESLTNLQRINKDAPNLLTALLRLPGVASQALDAASPGPWLLQRLKAVFGADVDARTAVTRIAAWLPLRDRIYNAAKDALATRLPAEISILLDGSSGDTVLANAAFRMTPAGLSLLHQVLQGDLSPLFNTPNPDLRVGHGLLSHHLRRARHVELHLPFLDNLNWTTELRALASARVTCDAAGRLFTIDARAETLHQTANQRHSTLIFAAALSARDAGPVNDNFTLTFEDTRPFGGERNHDGWLRLLAAYGIQPPPPPDKPVQGTLSLVVPGRYLDLWAHAPRPGDEDYVSTLCRVARALQTAMRHWVPALYFADLTRFRSPASAFPLLAYQYSAAYADVKRAQYSYDFMSTEELARAIRSAIPGLRAMLPGLQSTLARAGARNLLGYYDRRYLTRTLENMLYQPRTFQSLLAADTFFIESIIRIFADAVSLHSLYARKPLAAIRGLTSYSRSLVTTFHSRLRRLYASDDYSALGSLLLVEATAALAGDHGVPIPIAATLKLEQDGRQCFYTNQAARDGLAV